MGGLTNARKHYEQALEIRSDYITSTLNLARLDYQGRDFQSTKLHYEKLLEAHPANVSALNAMARLALGGVNKDAALPLLERARAASKADINSRLLLDKEYINTNPSLALTIAEEAHAAPPNNPNVLEALARSQLNNPKFELARDNFTVLVTEHAGSADLRYELGIAQVGFGDQAPASESWNEVLKLNPDCLNATIALARLAISNG